MRWVRNSIGVERLHGVAQATMRSQRVHDRCGKATASPAAALIPLTYPQARRRSRPIRGIDSCPAVMPPSAALGCTGCITRTCRPCRLRQFIEESPDVVRVDVIRPHHCLDQVVGEQRLQTRVRATYSHGDFLSKLRAFAQQTASLSCAKRAVGRATRLRRAIGQKPGSASGASATRAPGRGRTGVLHEDSATSGRSFQERGGASRRERHRQQQDRQSDRHGVNLSVTRAG
jgi:hypothetical protein